MKPIITYLKELFNSPNGISESQILTGKEKANQLLSSLIQDKMIPGLAITVLKDGEVIFKKGYGFASIEGKIPVNPEKTIFRIASISKNISAIALACAVEEGLIDLDASLYEYVPYFPKKEYDFTIRQLASHTAGIRGYRGKEYGLNKPYTIKDSLEVFANDELIFEPGTGYHYNSFDWVLISLAIQEVSGISFEEYVQQKVLSPLGMENTFAEGHLEQNQNGINIEMKLIKESFPGKTEDLGLSQFYSKNKLGFRKAIPVNNRYKLAGGGYLSTSDDIAKFGQAILKNGIVDVEILSQFLTAQIINGNSTYYGLGWQVSEDNKGRVFYGHVGNGVGGYSNLFVYPKEQMVFSILTNCTNPNIQKEWDEVVDGLLPNEKIGSLVKG